TGIPKPYLSKIIGRLVSAELVISRRGNRGGIWLARPAAEITLLEIAEKMDGEDFLGRCLLGEEYCSDSRACPTHAFWKKERAQIRKKLAATRLSDVIAFDDTRLVAGKPTQETLP
ncbi:MAG: Rrf2 family transcriptional regulator, partial [Pseudohongiellaceae bacterium]